jgi:hypothetical protein
MAGLAFGSTSVSGKSDFGDTVAESSLCCIVDETEDIEIDDTASMRVHRCTSVARDSNEDNCG